MEKMKIRLIETPAKSAFMNMGIDEALMNLTTLPTLRLYSWKPSAVSLGYFQNVTDEVNVEKCRELGVDVVRRVTGGGAVFHDTELTYSFITKNYPPGSLEAYQLICGAVIKGLAKVGVNAAFAPLNDIVMGGKKISGNAQTRKKSVLLQHGTILLQVDVEKMFSILKVPDEKMKDKIIKNVKERVVGLNMPFDNVSDGIKQGFAEQFNAQLAPSAVTAEELLLAEKFANDKYSSTEWLFEKRV